MTDLRLVVLMGLPAAGKSTYAARLLSTHPRSTVLTADAIRTGARATGEFMRVFHRVRGELAAGQNVIVDTCALTRSNRVALLRIGQAAGARCELVVFDVSSATCRARDRARADSMPRTFDWQAAASQFREAKRAVYAEGWHAILAVKG